jgi:hypothetical protein
MAHASDVKRNTLANHVDKIWTLAHLPGIPRHWRRHLDRATVLIRDRMFAPEPPPAVEEPPLGWDQRLVLAPLTLTGYTFLDEEGGERTKPCEDNIEQGECPHVGVFLPICSTDTQATTSAKKILSRKGAAGWMLGEQRLVWQIKVDAPRIYDLRGHLSAPQAEYIRSQLFHADGKKEPVWRLVKTRNCQGIYLPTDPPTLFVYEKFYDKTVKLQPTGAPPVTSPSLRPYNVLDFVRGWR